MTAGEFRAVLERMGLSVRQTAPLIGVSERTCYGWARGEWPIPEPAARLVLVLEATAGGAAQQGRGRARRAGSHHGPAG